jgi:hypothetical protein
MQKWTPRISRSALTVCLLGLGATFAPFGLTAQSADMNFFLALEGPSWGADLPALEVSDQQCYDLAYAQGYGHLRWRAYLDGDPAEGEGDQKARNRIGTGPWYNYYGVLIAESVAQLHSDDNNLWHESAATVTGELAPEGAIEFPWGSELDGDDFTREGPFLCFGLPG